MRAWGALLASVTLLTACGQAEGMPRPSPAGPHLGAAPTPVDRLPLAPPATPPGSEVSDVGEVHFLDAAIGWAPVAQPCGPDVCVVVYASDDGGATWVPRTDPPVTVGDGSDARVAAGPAVRLATTEVGWLVDVEGGLYSTRDGARTWQREATDGAVVALEARGESVWRLEESCPPSNGRCRYAVVISDDGGATWRRTEPQPPLGEAGVSSLRPSFVRPSPDVAYLLSDTGDYPAGGHPGEPRPTEWRPEPVLARTGDGGRTWTTVSPPCPAPGKGGFWGFDLAASTPGDLWLTCGDEAGSGAMQPKHLFRSPDGGDHWSDDLGTPNSGAGGRTAAASPERACRGGNRTSITCTRDGGRTWFTPIPDSADNPRDGGVEVYQFVDGRHGWAIGQDEESGSYNVLWRTADGGESWTPAKVADAQLPR